MALTTIDLSKLEMRMRMVERDLRSECPEGALIDPANDAAARAGFKVFLDAADAYKTIGDLLLGMQGNWGVIGPLVRKGYQRMARPADIAGLAPAKTEDAA